MKMKASLSLVTVCILFFMGMSCWSITLDLESGAVVPGYNDVQVPGTAAGTRLSLSDALAIENKAYYRLRITKEVGNDKYVSVLYAPLSVEGQGVLKAPVRYNGQLFPASTAVSGVYRFDSYRVSYWKRYVRTEAFSWKLGFTAKIRDASIALKGNGITSEKKNTGFVPLLNIGCEYAFTKKLSFVFDADALAGGPGRAEDVLIAGKYGFSERSGVRVGYRFVEGGADVEEVYNFALINYLAIGFFHSF